MQRTAIKFRHPAMIRSVMAGWLDMVTAVILFGASLIALQYCEARQSCAADFPAEQLVDEA